MLAAEPGQKRKHTLRINSEDTMCCDVIPHKSIARVMPMLTDIPSERLTYRPLHQEDWPFFLALNQDREVMRYISDARTATAIHDDSFVIRLPAWQRGSTHWLCLVITEKVSSLPIGVTGLIERGDDIAEVGFILSARFQGKGFGQESLRDLTDYAFTVLGYRKLVATVTAGNDASRKTLLKTGFKQEGTLRKNWFMQGEWHDDWVFGLLREEYTCSR